MTDRDATEYQFRDAHKVNIILWHTRDAFLAHAPGVESHYHAFFHPYIYNIYAETGKVLWQEHIGELHFVAGNYGSGLVSHECCHAVFHLAQMAQMDLREKDEEFCYELGR